MYGMNRLKILGAGPAHNRVFAAAGLRLFAEMAFVTAAAVAPAAPTGPGGPDGHLANTTNVMRKAR